MPWRLATRRSTTVEALNAHENPPGTAARAGRQTVDGGRLARAVTSCQRRNMRRGQSSA
jgi:hypothetical protein